jgi:hypothetical protein
MTRPDFSDASWSTSSYSTGNGGECVEVAEIPGWVGIRDSKQHGRGLVLAVTPAAWAAFRHAVPDGEFG